MDLVDEESKQLVILQEFLPKLMERAEIEEFVKGKISEMGTIDSTKKGMFMSSLMKELKGKADGAMVKEFVDLLFK